MQLELECSECHDEFESASALLQHFATHVQSKTKKLPELHPLTKGRQTPLLMDIGQVEDPLRFCSVTINEGPKDCEFSNSNNVLLNKQNPDSSSGKQHKKINSKIPDLKPIDKNLIYN